MNLQGNQNISNDSVHFVLNGRLSMHIGILNSNGVIFIRSKRWKFCTKFASIPKIWRWNLVIGYLFAHFRSKSVSRYARLAKIGLRNIHRQYFSYLFDPFYVERNFVELIFHWIAIRLNLCAKLPLFASRGNNSVDTIIIHTQHAINTFNAQSLLAKVAAIKHSYSFVHTLY